MKTDKVERILADEKFQHLTSEVLASYLAERLDAISRAQTEAHLKLCLSCEKSLMLLQEESAEVAEYKPSFEDIALAKHVRQLAGTEQRLPTADRKATAYTVRMGRLSQYVQQAAASWQTFAMRVAPVREVKRGGTEVWRWRSEDERFVVYAVLEKTSDLTLHFSTTDPQLEGVRPKVKVGSRNRVATLKRVSESESHAQIVIKRQQRPKRLTDISIASD